MSQKLIVMIDDDPVTLEMCAELLESKDFKVETFNSFETALPFIEQNKPELIISDLIGHDDMNGVEFYLRHIIDKRIQFAIWSGSVDLGSKDGVNSLGTFLQGMPEDYRVSYDPNQALDQQQVDLIVEDFKNKEKRMFPCFPKPGDLNQILKYFNFFLRNVK